MSATFPILVVDDSMPMRLTIQNMLTTAGYREIDLASNGKIAWQRVTDAVRDGKCRYKVIFLDWNMPEMDGITFLRLCRADPILSDVAIIMLTAISDKKSVIEALNSGATSYIIKPASADTVLKKLNQVAASLKKN